MSGRWPPPGCGACCTFRYPAPAALPAFSAWGTAPAVRSSRRSCPCWSRWPWWPGWYRPPTSWTARLARELHDSVEQTLYGISLGAGTASELLRHDPLQAHQPIAWIQETAVAGLTDLRGLIQGLRPEALAGDGVTGALVRLLETLQRLPGCRTIADLGPEPATTVEVKQALYRIAQEALQNVAKHARAAQVTLRVVNDGTTVVLEVIDDGQGFVPNTGFPGRLGIVSGPGNGTVVRAVLPARA